MLTKNKILNIILYSFIMAISIAIGILFLLDKDIFEQKNLYIAIITTVLILIYVILFLFKLIRNEKYLPLIIVKVIEIVILAILVIGFFIPSLHLTSSLVVVFGIILWLRGIVDTIENAITTRIIKLKIIFLIVDILLLSIGAVLMINSPFPLFALYIVLSVISFLIALFSLIMLIIAIKKQKN